MSTTAPTFNTHAIGRWSDPVEFEVTRERIKQYAAATNDPIAPHADGDLAPPVFAVVPAFSMAGEAAMKVIPSELVMMTSTGSTTFISTRRSVPARRSPPALRRSASRLVPAA